MTVDPAFAVDRHGQAEPVLVVGVVADEVDAPGSAPGVVARRRSVPSSVEPQVARASTAGEVRSVGRIQRSWYLGKLSWRVLRDDRTLAAFPVLMAIGALICSGSSAASSPLAGIDRLSGSNDSSSATDRLGAGRRDVPRRRRSSSRSSRPALVLGANERLDGRDATVGGCARGRDAPVPGDRGLGDSLDHRVDHPPGDRGAGGVRRPDHRRACSVPRGGS